MLGIDPAGQTCADGAQQFSEKLGNVYQSFTITAEEASSFFDSFCFGAVLVLVKTRWQTMDHQQKAPQQVRKHLGGQKLLQGNEKIQLPWRQLLQSTLLLAQRFTIYKPWRAVIEVGQTLKTQDLNQGVSGDLGLLDFKCTVAIACDSGLPIPRNIQGPSSGQNLCLYETTCWNSASWLYRIPNHPSCHKMVI